MSFIQTLLTASIPALLVAILGFFAYRLDVLRFRSAQMAERAVRHFMQREKQPRRSFKALKMHLGGWDDDENELRRILVRAGAVRIDRTDEGDNGEWWVLLDRMREHIRMKEKTKRSAGN